MHRLRSALLSLVAGVTVGAPLELQAQTCSTYCYDCAYFTNAVISRSPGNSMLLNQDCGWVWCNACGATFAAAQKRALRAVDSFVADGDIDALATALVDDAAVIELNEQRSAVQLRNCENRVVANFPVSPASYARLTQRVAALNPTVRRSIVPTAVAWEREFNFR